MPVSVIVTTPASPFANSYCSVAEADQYHEDHTHGESWSLKSTNEKARGLITATRLIDEGFEFSGQASTSEQVLAWPRVGMFYITGDQIDSNVIPDGLKRATAEFARQLLTAASDRTADSEIETAGITSLKAGPVELTFSGAIAKVVPDAVVQVLTLWGWRRGKGAVNVPLVRS